MNAACIEESRFRFILFHVVTDFQGQQKPAFPGGPKGVQAANHGIFRGKILKHFQVLGVGGILCEGERFRQVNSHIAVIQLHFLPLSVQGTAQQGRDKNDRDVDFWSHMPGFTPDT